MKSNLGSVLSLLLLTSIIPCATAAPTKEEWFEINAKRVLGAANHQDWWDLIFTSAAHDAAMSNPAASAFYLQRIADHSNWFLHAVGNKEWWDLIEKSASGDAENSGKTGEEKKKFYLERIKAHTE